MVTRSIVKSVASKKVASPITAAAVAATAWAKEMKSLLTRRPWPSVRDHIKLEDGPLCLMRSWQCLGLWTRSPPLVPRGQAVRSWRLRQLRRLDQNGKGEVSPRPGAGKPSGNFAAKTPTSDRPTARPWAEGKRRLTMPLRGPQHAGWKQHHRREATNCGAGGWPPLSGSVAILGLNVRSERPQPFQWGRIAEGGLSTMMWPRVFGSYTAIVDQCCDDPPSVRS